MPNAPRTESSRRRTANITARSTASEIVFMSVSETVAVIRPLRSSLNTARSLAKPACTEASTAPSD
jgi:hypothetical protein